MFITDPADLAALKQEAVNDPKGIGLTLLEADDAANAARLNNEPVAPQTTMKLRVDTVSTQDLFEACDPVERQALTDRQYREFETAVGFGQLFPANAPKTVAGIQALFGPTAKSTPALSALLYRDGSRAEQMHQEGLFSQQYYITPSDYANARQLP
jgi:hypothetical protein